MLGKEMITENQNDKVVADTNDGKLRGKLEK
jgi:hypothetical protein